MPARNQYGPGRVPGLGGNFGLLQPLAECAPRQHAPERIEQQIAGPQPFAGEDDQLGPTMLIRWARPMPSATPASAKNWRSDAFPAYARSVRASIVVSEVAKPA